MPFNIRTPLWMRFPELRWSPPRKVISEGWQYRHPLNSEIFLRKNSLFSKREDEKKDGGGGAVSVLLIFFFLRGKTTSSMGVGGGGWGGWWPSNGIALEINFAKEGIGCPFWTESL